jgi:hypothetical protein
MRTRNIPSGIAAISGQQGMISTLIALIVLVATLLAAMALMKSVDTANSIAGSMTFRQGAMQEAERAYQDIRTNLETTFKPPASDQDGAGGTGYYAEMQPHTSTTRPDIPDILLNKTDGAVAVMADGVTKNHVSYVVERLCPSNGPATVTTCIVPGTAISGGTSSNLTTDPGIPFNTTGSAAAFRLTVRVDGPRNSVAYVQTILR